MGLYPRQYGIYISFENGHPIFITDFCSDSNLCSIDPVSNILVVLKLLFHLSQRKTLCNSKQLAIIVLKISLFVQVLAFVLSSLTFQTFVSSSLTFLMVVRESSQIFNFLDTPLLKSNFDP